MCGDSFHAGRSAIRGVRGEFSPDSLGQEARQTGDAERISPIKNPRLVWAGNCGVLKKDISVASEERGRVPQAVQAAWELGLSVRREEPGEHPLYVG
jgi:hypothetical protein